MEREVSLAKNPNNYSFFVLFFCFVFIFFFSGGCVCVTIFKAVLV